jgi:transposase-like protein
MDVWGIAARNSSARSGPPLTHDLLNELYANQGKSIAEIADELGVNHDRVDYALRAHGMTSGQIKPLVNQLGAAEFWFLHHEQRLSYAAIARKFSCDFTSVRRRMREVGVPFVNNQMPIVAEPDRPPHISSPDFRLIRELEEEATRRPRKVTPNAIDDISADEFRSLHIDQQLSISEIARRFGTKSHRVNQRARELGVETHRRGSRRKPLTDVEIKRRNALCENSEIQRVLDKHQIKRDYDPQDVPVDLTEPLLHDLYEDCQLSLRDIGLLCIRAGSLATALRRFGIEVRPVHLPKPTKTPIERLTRKRLEALVESGKSIESIAEHFGYSSRSMKNATRVLQVSIDGRSRDVPKAVTDELRRAGIDEQHAKAILNPRRLGTGAHADIPAWKGIPSPVLVKYLFEDLHLNRKEVIDRFHLPGQLVEQTFSQAGIAKPQSRNVSPFAAWDFDAEELWALTRQGMNAAEIAKHFGVNHAMMLRVLHRHHLPVRVRGGGGPEGKSFIRYDELTSNEGILAALKNAGVPLAGVNPPRRGPLPPQLIDELHNEFQLSNFDIELLTGRRYNAVDGDARRSQEVVPSLRSEDSEVLVAPEF